MSQVGFLYFLPDEDSTVSASRISEVGLDYAFDAPPDKVGSPGPDGARGVVMCHPGGYDRDHPLAYLPDRQAWRRAPGCSYHVGYYTDAVPSSLTLQRPRLVMGHEVALGDGGVYVIPVARGVDDASGQVVEACQLPQRATLNDDGEWILDGVESQYAALWEIAQRWFDDVMAVAATHDDSGPTRETAMTVSEALDASVLAIGVNYRIGRAEASMLGLLSTDRYAEVLGALIDWPSWEALLKKKESAGT